MEPVQLSYGVGRAHFALNRREPTAKGIKLGKNPAGPTDESVPILRVQKASGQPLAIVFGYACHNTTLRPGHDEDRRRFRRLRPGSGRG